MELSHWFLYQLQTKRKQKKKKSVPCFTVNVFLNHLQIGGGNICFKGNFPPSFYYISIIFFIEYFIEEFYCSSHSCLSVSAIKGVVGVV